MGLFDKLIKDVQKSVEKAVNDAVKDEADKAVDQAVDKAEKAVGDQIARTMEKEAGEAVSQAAEASEGIREAQESMKGSSDDLKKALSDLDKSLADLKTTMAEADREIEAATKDITPEQWQQATSTLERMAMDRMSKMHLCLECDEPYERTGSCPRCGSPLSEKSITELALCPSCGKQNNPGEESCGACGADLPYKALKQQHQRSKDDAVMARFAAELPYFPAWTGGTHYDLSELEKGRYYFSAWFENDSQGATDAINAYRETLERNGFRQAGKYPGPEHLYKMIDGVCYHADLEHCFEGDDDTPSVYFMLGDEPEGGFDYVKPEPKKKAASPFGSLFR